MDKRFNSLKDKSVMERSHEGSSMGGASAADISGNSKHQGALMVQSQVTGMQRSTLTENGMVQPFDQVMSNFAMYGLANRHTLSGPVDTSPQSQVDIMQELSGLCLKIYRSVNPRFQRIAQMMLSGNTQELKGLIETNFHYKLQSYQSLVVSRISAECLMVDES